MNTTYLLVKTTFYVVFIDIFTTSYFNENINKMLESAFEQLKLSEGTDDFEQFLLLFEKEKKQGQNYVALSTLPKGLHYRLIQEDFIIKREERTIKRFLFFKRNVLYYIVRPSQ